MKILGWRKKENVSSCGKDTICYTTISGDMVCLNKSDIKNSPKYKTRFGRVIGIADGKKTLKQTL